MAIYDLDSINEEMNTKKNNDLLDGLVETCDQMLSMIDEGARTKYVEMKGKQAEDLMAKADSMPDKEAKERTKKIGPYSFKYTKDIDNRRTKQDMDSKAIDAAITANKYAGTYEDFGPKGKKETGSDGKTHYSMGALHGGLNPSSTIHKAGKPYTRYDKGTHADKYGIARSTTVDHEAIVKSKAGKDQFNKDFGGPNNHDSYVNTKKLPMHKPYKWNNGQLEDWQKESNKKRIQINKDAIKNELQKKGLIKETCEYILSVIDEIE